MKMKTMTWAIIPLIVTFATGCRTAAISQMQRSETRALDTDVHAPPPITYDFDDSFRKSFGEEGVQVVHRAMERVAAKGITDPDEIMREIQQEWGAQ